MGESEHKISLGGRAVWEWCFEISLDKAISTALCSVKGPFLSISQAELFSVEESVYKHRDTGQARLKNISILEYFYLDYFRNLSQTDRKLFGSLFHSAKEVSGSSKLQILTPADCSEFVHIVYKKCLIT